MPARPLADLTVLDLTTALAGPFATFLLAGLGARVIKVENPAAPDSCRTNSPFLGPEGPSLTWDTPDHWSMSALERLRNKQAVTLNLKHPEAGPILESLVRHSDVLVENFSPGVLERLGAGYEKVHAWNPKLVYCSITGFGAGVEGKAMDTIIQALSGAMHTSGEMADPPVRLGIPYADLTTPLFGVIGVLAAVLEAQRTGLGQHVDVSMLGVMTMLNACEHLDVLAELGLPARSGATAPRLAPFGIYQTEDDWVAICAHTEGFGRSLFEIMGKSDLLADPRYATRDARVRSAEEVDALVGAWTRQHLSSEVLDACTRAGVPAAPVRNLQQALADPRVWDREEIVPLRHPASPNAKPLPAMGLPIQFSGVPAGFDHPAPQVAEHNHEIYEQFLGYTAAQLQDWKARGVI